MVRQDAWEESTRSCDLVVVTCSDWRIWEEDLRQHLGWAPEGERRFDLLAFPGSVHDLVHGGEEVRTIIFGWMDKLVSYHLPETVLLIPHMHCAVYHAGHAFADDEQERQHLEKDIGAARELIVARYPRVTVLGYIAEIDRDARRLTGLSQTRFSVPPPIS